MITRKIPFTLIFTLLFFPLSGQVRAADVSTLLIDGAAKGIGKWAAGEAMDSIFPQDAEPSRKTLEKDIGKSTMAIRESIGKAVEEIEAYISEENLKSHISKLGDSSISVITSIHAYDPKITMSSRPPTPQQINTNDNHIQDVIDTSFAFSEQLDQDIKISTKTTGYSGFWRSFPTYVSNKVTNVAFLIEQWKTKQAQDGFLADGNQPFTITTNIVENLEDIYNHLEKNVPTLPVSDGSHVQNGNPTQQNVNCALRTDPDTHLFTSKGEFISRYRGLFDVADRLPDPTRYWMMYAYCRSDWSNKPDVYYGWKNVNVNYRTAPKTVGPVARIDECQRVVTFGTCQSSGNAYGCTMSPFGGSAESQPSNEIGGIDDHRGRTLYTKYLWADGPHAIAGTTPILSTAGTQYNYKESLDKFIGYLKIFENTVCKNDPSGKNIATQIPAAPVLPSLNQALFDNDTYTFTATNKYPDKIQNSLPLTVIKVQPNYLKSDVNNTAKDVSTYYFIKRNSKSKFPELSKPYQSAMSAAHERSLHYFTEFNYEELPAAYCQIASMVSIGNLTLSTLEAKIKQEELVITDDTPTLSKITKRLDRYRKVTHKLGITKENAAHCFLEAKSNHIVASLRDLFTRTLDQKDHKMRSCMNVAANDVYEAESQDYCPQGAFKDSRDAYKCSYNTPTDRRGLRTAAALCYPNSHPVVRMN